MAVAKAALLEPQTEPEVEVKDVSLVIGAGVAGMTAALSMANQGFKVYLIEKEKEPGGITRRLYKIYPTLADSSEVVEPLIEAVKSHKNIELMTSTTLKDVLGYIGNFNTVLTGPNGDREINVGTIIVASGSSNYTPPKGLYQYGNYDHVITQRELDEKLRKGEIGEPERIIMIQCVGARKGEIQPSELEAFPKSDTAELLRKILKARKEEGWPYCSRICCMNAIKNAILIKEKSPKTDVVILFGDLRVYKEYEDFYRRARDLEVRFVRHIEGVPEEIAQTPEGKLQVMGYDALSGLEVEFLADWVVLSTPLIPNKDEILLARMLKIPIGTDGFMMEAHLKLRPVDTNVDGVFIAGTVSGPKDVSESIISGGAAAARASIPMGNRKVRTEAITAVVDEDLCIGCGLCEEICPYGAPKIEDGKSKIREILCRGCGSCAAECPRRAITMRHFGDHQILAQVKALLVPQSAKEVRA
jgi:heterodisulfide reductase subunit A